MGMWGLLFIAYTTIFGYVQLGWLQAGASGGKRQRKLTAVYSTTSLPVTHPEVMSQHQAMV